MTNKSNGIVKTYFISNISNKCRSDGIKEKELNQNVFYVKLTKTFTKF